MKLFKSKRVEELEKEKEEVLIRLNSITEKEDTVRHLNDVLKKMRIEVASLNDKRLNLSKDIELLNAEKEQISFDIEGLGQEVLNLRHIKHEEQNSLLSYSDKIDKIKNRIDESEKDYSEENGADADFEDKRDEIKLLQKEYEELQDKILSAEQTIEELSETEDQLTEQIKEKREELENFNTEKL
jgi:chromosome segregation ATPase